MTRLPKTLQTYVDHLAEIQPAGFAEIVAITPRVNWFRELKRRGLIEDIIRPYDRFEAFTGPRTSLYVLTVEGWRHVTRVRAEVHESALFAPKQAKPTA